MKTKSSQNNYRRLLLDARWQKKRLEVLSNANFKCQDAGCHSPENIPLEVHHCYYLYGKKPWDYPDEAFLALCHKCHVERQELESEIKIALLRRLRCVPIRRLVKIFSSWLDEAVKEESV